MFKLYINLSHFVSFFKKKVYVSNKYYFTVIKMKYAGISLSKISKNADGLTHGDEPLGLLYTLAMADEAGWETELFDLSRFSSKSELIKAIYDSNPDIVGFSVDDLSRNDALEIAKNLKERRDITTLFGGYHPSACPEIVLKNEVDYVITGEAEEVLPQLLGSFPQRPTTLENLAYEEDGRLFRDEHYLRQKEYTLTFPAPSDQTGVAQLVINRGCVYACKFCSSAGIYGKRFSKRNIEDALDEIRELKERDVNLMIINDLDLTLNKEFAERFSQRLIESGLSENLYFEALGNTLTTTPKLLESLYQAGVRKIGYGVESINPQVLKFINKKVDQKNLRSLLDVGKKLGILTSSFYQIGYPMETEDSIRRNIQELTDSGLFFPRLRLVIATPTSGTPWHDQLKREFPWWPHEEDWDIFDTQHLAYPHAHFSDESLRSLRDELQLSYYQSDFYRRELAKFLEEHPELEKSFVECGWDLK